MRERISFLEPHSALVALVIERCVRQTLYIVQGAHRGDGVRAGERAMLFEPGSVPLVYTDGAVARAMKVDLAPAPGRDLHSSGRIGITRGTRPRLRSAQSRGRRRARLPDSNATH